MTGWDEVLNRLANLETAVKNLQSAFAKAQPQETTRGTRLHPSWYPSEETLEWAYRTYTNHHVEAEWAKFVDYWQGVSGKRGTKLNWDATFRNWLRNSNVERANSKTVRAARDLGAG